jgi:hypothetical protein
MTQFEAQAAAPILRDVFGDAEVRQLGCEPFDYFVRVYVGIPLPTVTDVSSADAAGRLIAERIKGA